MDEIKMRPYDGLAIAGFLTLPGLLFTQPAALTGQSAGAAWMAVLGAHIGVLCLFLLVTCLMSLHRGRNLITAAIATVGAPLGRLYGLFLAAYFCITTGLLVREGAEIFKAYGLALTPIYVVIGLTLACALVMNIFGGKAIIKSMGLFFLLVLLGIVFILLLGLNRYNPDYIFPIMGNGGHSIALSGLRAACMIDGVLILALFANDFADTRGLRKAGVMAISISAMLSVLFFLCLVMMFSAPISANMMSGFMEMGKSIYYNRFFYRFESVLLFFLIFSSVLTACLGLYIARKSAALAVGTWSHKLLSIVGSVIILAIALVPDNLYDLVTSYLDFSHNYSIFFIAGVPLFLLAITAFRRLFRV